MDSGARATCHYERHVLWIDCLLQRHRGLVKFGNKFFLSITKWLAVLILIFVVMCDSIFVAVYLVGVTSGRLGLLVHFIGVNGNSALSGQREYRQYRL